MARICENNRKGPRKGSIIWRSGKSKKSGGYRHARDRDHQATLFPEPPACQDPHRRPGALCPSFDECDQEGPDHQGTQAHVEEAGSSRRQGLTLFLINQGEAYKLRLSFLAGPSPFSRFMVHVSFRGRNPASSNPRACRVAPCPCPRPGRLSPGRLSSRAKEE